MWNKKKASDGAKQVWDWICLQGEIMLLKIVGPVSVLDYGYWIMDGRNFRDIRQCWQGILHFQKYLLQLHGIADLEDRVDTLESENQELEASIIASDNEIDHYQYIYR